jgi:hypothetical protein
LRRFSLMESNIEGRRVEETKGRRALYRKAYKKRLMVANTMINKDKLLSALRPSISSHLSCILSTAIS